MRRSNWGNSLAGVLAGMLTLAVVATVIVLSPWSHDRATAASGAQVSSTPLGPPAPASGWTPVFADGFGAPLGTGHGKDNLWYPNQPWQPSPASLTRADNGPDTNAYSSSQVHSAGGELLLSARYQLAALNATATFAQANYVSGMVATNEDTHRCTSEVKSSCYRPWYWIPKPGASWAFQIVCQFPVNTGELFNAFWTTSNSRWVNERDFFEGRPIPSKNVTFATPTNDSQLDASWIWNTNPIHASIYHADAMGQVGISPSTQMNTYTYVINPDQSWSLYINGIQQPWVGSAPSEPSWQNVRMHLEINYALNATTFTSGTRSFAIRSVAVYEDTATAHAGGHPFSSGTTIAPGTSIAAPVALAASGG